MMRHLAALCFLPLLHCNSFAAAADQPPGESFTIQVSAKLVQAPCWMKLNSRDQTVVLPPVPTTQLSAVGNKSAKTDFRIEMRGCTSEPGVQVDKRSGLKTWSVDSPVVSVMFTGVQDAESPSLFAVSGATGIALEITDSRGNTVLPGIATAPFIVQTINAAMPLQVALVRTSAPLTPGSWRAVLQFVVNYD